MNRVKRFLRSTANVVALIAIVLATAQTGVARDTRPNPGTGSTVPASIDVPTRWTCSRASAPAALPAGIPQPAEYRSVRRAGSGWDIRREGNSIQVRFLTFDVRGRPVWYTSHPGIVRAESEVWSGALYRQERQTDGLRHVLVGSAAVRFIPEHPGRVALRWRMGSGAIGVIEEEECLWSTNAAGTESHRWTVDHTEFVELQERRSPSDIRSTVLTHDQAGLPVWTTGVAAVGVESVTQQYYRSIYRGDVPQASCVAADCVSASSAGNIVGTRGAVAAPSVNIRLDAVGIGADGADQVLSLAVPADPLGRAALRSSQINMFWVRPGSLVCQASNPTSTCEFEINWTESVKRTV